VLGSDAVVLTAMVNLPTGAERDRRAAGAFRAGEWNLGVAGSARLSDDFTPFEDAEGDFTYQSGLEARARFGADRLVGNGKLALGLTLSTFSDDEFANGSGATGVYRPGQRVIGEVSYTSLIGKAIVTGYLWDYYRTSGDSSGASVVNQENLFAAGVASRIPMSPTLNLEPGAELRFSNPSVGNAVLLEVSAAARIRLSSRYTLIPVARLDFGRLEEPEPGIGHSIRGGGISVFLRWSL
jgi:hypothetical protein